MTPPTPMRAIALAAVLALALAVTVYSEVNPRHTPGFPELLPENLEDLLRYLRSIYGNGGESAELLRLLESENVGEIAGSLKSDFPRNIVLEASGEYARGRLTREDLYHYLQLLQEWYTRSSASGIDVTEDYLLALRALSALAERAGYQDFSNYVDTLIYEALRSLVMEGPSTPTSGISQLAPESPEPGVFEPPELSLPGGLKAPEFEIPAPSLGLPGLTLPSLPAMSFNHINWSLIGWIVTPILAVVLAFALVKWRHSLTSMLSKITQHLKPLSTTQGHIPGMERLPRSILLYWLAVEHVSRRYSIQREPSTTHREFLLSANKILDDQRRDSMTNLTRVYELVRYGGVHSPLLDEDAERAYRELVEKA